MILVILFFRRCDVRYYLCLLSLLALLLSLACSGPDPSPPSPLSAPTPVLDAPETSFPPVQPPSSPPVISAGTPPPAVLPPGIPLTEAAIAAPPGILPSVTSGGKSDPPAVDPAPVDASQADADRIFRDAVAAMSAVSSYRYSMEIIARSAECSPLEEALISIDGRFAAPDRSAMVMSVGLGFLSIDVSAVSIGDDVYTMDPITGEWTLDEPGAQAAAPSPLAFTRGDFPDDLSYEGLEELESGPAHHLSARVAPGVLDTGDLGLGSGVEGVEAHYWIGVDDLLFRSFRVAFSQLEDGVSADVEITAEFMDYGADISVERPLVGEALASARSACDAVLQGLLASRPGAGDSAWVNSLVSRVREDSPACGAGIWKRRATDWGSGMILGGCITELHVPDSPPAFMVDGAALPSSLVVGEGSPSAVTVRDESGNMLIYWELDLFGDNDACWLYLEETGAWWAGSG